MREERRCFSRFAFFVSIEMTIRYEQARVDNQTSFILAHGCYPSARWSLRETVVFVAISYK